MVTEAPQFVFPEHFGFCGGVAAADELVAQVADEAQRYGLPVYGLHQIVHNQQVVEKHEARGVQFMEGVDQIPGDSLVIISAHGAGPEVVYALRAQGCEVFDATCPLVVHTHKGVQTARREGEKVLYVCHGKPGTVEKLHDEVAGVLGHLDFCLDEEGGLVHHPIERAYMELDEDPALLSGLLSDQGKYHVVTQTTLHADRCLAYRERVRDYILALQPEAQVAWSSQGDVCRAVANRQAGVEQLVSLRPRQIVVVTDPGSKNGMGYAKLAERLVEHQTGDTKVYAIADGDQASRDLAEAEGVTGVTASASTPYETIAAVTRALGAATTPPETADRTFSLEHGKTAVITEKVAAHLGYLAKEQVVDPR